MKRIILLLLVLTLTISVQGWMDCTPASCSSGYTNNGIYCTGGTCYRNCTAYVCDDNWVQVHHDNAFGIDKYSEDEASTSSLSYTASDASHCYQFVFNGPPASASNILMSVTDTPPNPPGDCDSEAIGGFAQGSTPWFSSMSGYVGAQTNSFASFMISSMRAHSETDSDTTYENDANKEGYIYCAPNSVACGKFKGTKGCDTDCYNVATQGKEVQGYYEDDVGGGTGPPNTTLYNGDRCGDTYVSRNLLNPANFSVYEATATGINTSLTSCDRTNEAPSVSNVLVLPFNATSGQDLNCNYTYYDIEGYAEQGSSFEWWKNSVNQNINDFTLNKGNLTTGDSWYCKVTPGDGLATGSIQQSNSLLVVSTVRNVTLFVGTAPIWHYDSYFAGPELILNMTDALNTELDTCISDVEGYCTINITFSSTAAGNLSLSRLGIYYEDLSTASESEARTAMEQGINTSNVTNYSLFSDYQIYARYSSGTQKLGRFDRVVMAGNQTWAFNYVNANESFTTLTNLANNTLVVWENQTLTETQITSQVSNLINRTKW